MTRHADHEQPYESTSASSIDGKAYQLALTLFNDLSQVGATAENLPPEVGFAKNNIFVNIVDMSVSARRAIDVLYFITAQEPEYKSGYTVDLEVFKWLMGYSSGNRKHLQSVLRQGQKAAIELEAEGKPGADGADGNTRWVSVPMLGPVGISNGKVYFDIPMRLQAEIKSPAASHFLSLRYVFKSIHAKILFDRLQLHIDHGMTPWIPLEELRAWWSFGPDEYAEFKKMRQRVISKAVDLVNEVTGLKVSFATKNVPGSKRVGSIRFTIEKTDKFAAPQSSMIALKAQYEVLRNEFGLSGAQLDEIVSHRDEWNDDRVEKAIEYTRHQLNQGKVKRNVAGYLMKAIREAYTLGSAQKVLDISGPAKPNVGVGPTAGERAVAEQNKHHQADLERMSEVGRQGFDSYRAMHPDSQTEAVRQFLTSLPAKTLAMQLDVELAALSEMIADNEIVQEQLGTFVVMQARSTARRRRFTPAIPEFVPDTVVPSSGQ